MAQLFLVFFFAWCVMAAPNRTHTHAKAPFSILSLVESDERLLYLGSNKGLYRYDGFHYSPVEGYPFESSELLATTSDGTLWIASRREGLARYRPETGFTVVRKEPVATLEARGTSVFFHTPTTRKLVKLDVAGGEQSVADPFEYTHTPLDSKGVMWLAQDRTVMALHTEGLRMEQKLVLGQRVWAASEDEEGRLWVLTDSGVEAWRDTRRVVEPTGRLNGKEARLLAGQGGQVWLLAGGTVRGLSPRTEFAVSVQGSVALLEGRNGHLWLGSTKGDLVELIPDAQWEQWLVSEFDGATPRQVVRGAQGVLLALAGNRCYGFSETTRKWTALGSEGNGYRYLFPLPQGDFLASTADGGLVRTSSEGRMLERIAGGDEFGKIVAIPDGPLAIAGKKGLYELVGKQLRAVTLPDRGGMVTDLAVDGEGKLWVGFANGIAVRDREGKWQALPAEPAVKNIQTFALRAPGDIWLAETGQPGFSRVLKGKTTRFTASNGYAPEETSFLKPDRRGWIWRGTRQGIAVTNGDEIDPRDWMFIETGGEPAPHGFYEDKDWSLWVSGTAGISHIRVDLSWFMDSSGSTGLSRVVADGRTIPLESLVINPPPKELRLQLSALNSPSYRKPVVLYRLEPGAGKWQTAVDGLVVLRNLPAGKYVLRTKMAGPGSEAKYEFRLGSSPWSKLWWGLLLFPLAGLGLFLARERLVEAWERWRGYAGTKLGHEIEPIPSTNRRGEYFRDRYQLMALISRQSGCEVYRAVDETSGAPVAIKIFEPRAGATAEQEQAREKEFAVLLVGPHPVIAAASHAAVEPGKGAFLVMPWLEGKSLRQAMASEAWSPERLANLLLNLGEGLAALHRAGVVHGNVRPENVLLRPDGAPVLLGLGASKIGPPGEESDYEAREQTEGFHEPASDVHALAAIGFEMINNTKIATSQIVLSSAQPGTPYTNSKVLDLLAQGLGPDPEARPAPIDAYARQLAAELTRGDVKH